jgi:hypothetical protein
MDRRAIGVAVVGHDALDADAVGAKEAHRSPKKPHGGMDSFVV